MRKKKTKRIFYCVIPCAVSKTHTAIKYTCTHFSTLKEAAKIWVDIPADYTLFDFLKNCLFTEEKAIKLADLKNNQKDIEN